MTGCDRREIGQAIAAALGALHNRLAQLEHELRELLDERRRDDGTKKVDEKQIAAAFDAAYAADAAEDPVRHDRAAEQQRRAPVRR